MVTVSSVTGVRWDPTEPAAPQAASLSSLHETWPTLLQLLCSRLFSAPTWAASSKCSIPNIPYWEDQSLLLSLCCDRTGTDTQFPLHCSLSPALFHSPSVTAQGRFPTFPGTPFSVPPNLYQNSVLSTSPFPHILHVPGMEVELSQKIPSNPNHSMTPCSLCFPLPRDHTHV